MTQVSAIEAGLAQIGSLQLCLLQLGVPEIRVNQIGICQSAAWALPALQQQDQVVSPGG